MSQTKAQLLNPLGDLELTGQLVGVGATFSGNVSIAGTLTKQDVTNVDSVGVITARSGIKVTAGGIDCTGITSITGADDTDNFVIDVGGGSQFVVHTDSSDGEISLRTQDGSGNNYSKYMTFFTQPSGAVVAPRLTITSSGGLKYHNADSPTNANSQAQILNHTGGLQIYGSSDSGTNRNIIFGTNSVAAGEVLRIASDGKVGIKTSSPGSPLEVNGGSALDTATFNSHHAQGVLINLQRSGTNIGFLGSGKNVADATGGVDDIGLRSQANLIFTSGGGTERLRIDGGGKIGIGTISPAEEVHIFGETAVVALVESHGANDSRVRIKAPSDRISYLEFADADDADVGEVRYDHSSNYMGFIVNAGERLRIGSSGQIGIAGANYGNAGQVLTSGGSGSAISWADAAGGAEFAGISSGSMSAGDPVIVHSDGKLSKVGYSWDADLYPNPAGDSNLVQPTSSAMQDYTVAVWGRNADGTFPAGSDPAVSFFYKSSSGGPQYRTSIVTNGTTNMAHEYSSGFNNGDSIGEFDVAWNPVATAAGGGGRLAAVFNRSGGGGGNYPAVQILRGPYSNGAWTQGGIQAMDSSAASQGGFSIAWHDANRWVTVYGQGGNYYGHVITLTGSTSASVGSRTAVETGLATMSYRGHMTDKDDNGKHIVFYAAKTTGNRNSWRYSVVTVSGTSVSFGTPNWIGDDANPGLAIGDFIPQTSFDPNQNRFLVVYYKQTATNGGGGINKIYARNAIISGTSVTWSAETQISAQNARGYDTFFDTNLKKHFVYLQDQSTSKVVYHVVNFTGSAAPSTNTEADAYSGSKELLDLGMDYDSTYGMVIVGGRKGNDGNNLAEFVQRTALSSSNLGDNNFVGFSKGNYTDGNTAKIGSLSALDENQTGLTTATTYYVKDDGTLSTTPSTPIVAAGHAVSSTNLIVKDATPRPGSLGHWSFYLQNCGSMKPWCVCGWNSSTGGMIGAYECANSSCRYCVGRWNPYCCIEDSVGSRYQWNRDLPTEGGGNMCLGCGGCCCCSQYYLERNCCCCWPTGRFWFPEVGMYCYNFSANMATCMGAPSGHGCWYVQTYYAVPMCRNRTCCNMFCQINGYQAYATSVCGYCEPKVAFDHVQLDGIVGVADTTKNWMSFAIMKSNMTNCVIVQNGICLITNACSGSGRQNKLTFQKISNDPLITYCN